MACGQVVVGGESIVGDGIVDVAACGTGGVEGGENMEWLTS